MESSRVKGRRCNSTVATAVLLLALLFAAEPASAKFDVFCFGGCMSHCTYEWFFHCIKRCHRECSSHATATDRRNGIVDHELIKY
ncbi:hypothetical protein F3Y22_tig00111877pilonHSYRG00309 [Hibiscus syriacus]|uniref:Uncharacterized protein n=1 Tax=Hibiscus syriacus TaxID=106335 RepID=A0A6A2YBC0_HIBSY|nr:hypothetical protein F3Y22_tig00111877pilonHSYRG00309 [Hibiscus syriacus]